MVDEKNCGENEGLSKRYGLGIRHLQLACMFVCMSVLYMGRASMGVAVLAMSDQTKKNNTNIEIYDWDKRTQSVILSSFFWGYMIMQVPSGILAKKYGGKPVLLVSLLVNGVIYVLTPIMANLGGWLMVCVARGVMGLSQACLFPATHTLLGQWLPPVEQTKFTGHVYGGVMMGVIIAMPVSGFLAETALGWKMIFYTLAVITFVTAALWHVLVASTPKYHRMISVEERSYIESQLNLKKSGPPPRTPWKAILTSKPLWAIVAPLVGSSMSFILFFVDLPTYFEKALGFSIKNSASLSAVPYVGMWIGNITSTILSDKLISKGLLTVVASRKLFESISLFGVATGLIILSFTENKAAAIVILIGILTVTSFASSGHTVNLLDLSPNYAGLLLSMCNFLANISCIMVPLLTGAVLGNHTNDLSRWRILFLLNASSCIITNIFYIIFASSDRQKWDDPNFLDKMNANPDELKVLPNDVKNNHTN